MKTSRQKNHMIRLKKNAYEIRMINNLCEDFSIRLVFFPKELFFIRPVRFIGSVRRKEFFSHKLHFSLSYYSLAF